MDRRGNRPRGERQKDIQKAATLYAAGHNQEEIGKQLGCHQVTVSKMLNTSEAKRILEQEANKYLQSLETISESTLTQINTANRIHKAIASETEELPGKLKDDIQTAIKYADSVAKREERILAGHGLISGNSQSIYIQNIYNDNKSVNLSPELLKALATHSNQNNTIIDITEEHIKVIGGK